MYLLDTPLWITETELALKIIGGIGGLILFIIGFKRYKKDQVWKRYEFVASEVKEFSADKMVRNVMYMLDWGSRSIELFPDKPTYEERYVRVNRPVFRAALQYHEHRAKDVGKDRFTPEEVAIRDNVDHFLSYFERFYQFIEAGLITKKEIEPYLKYWINVIAVELEAGARNILFHYINQYGFKDTQKLFDLFGKDIRPTTDISSTKIT